MTQEQDFQLTVTGALARLETGTAAIVEHLARLNGSVAKHETRIQAAEEFITTARATSKANARWLDRIAPALWAMAGALAALALANGPKILASMR